MRQVSLSIHPASSANFALVNFALLPGGEGLWQRKEKQDEIIDKQVEQRGAAWKNFFSRQFFSSLPPFVTSLCSLEWSLRKEQPTERTTFRIFFWKYFGLAGMIRPVDWRWSQWKWNFKRCWWLAFVDHAAEHFTLQGYESHDSLRVLNLTTSGVKDTSFMCARSSAKWHTKQMN